MSTKILTAVMHAKQHRTYPCPVPCVVLQVMFSASHFGKWRPGAPGLAYQLPVRDVTEIARIRLFRPPAVVNGIELATPAVLLADAATPLALLVPCGSKRATIRSEF